MSANLTAARKNQLLSSLPTQVLAKLLPDFHLQKVEVRDPLLAPGGAIEHVCFPVTCVVSTVAQGSEGQAIEVATVGNEGMIGVAVFLGTFINISLETFAQIAGEVLSMSAHDFRSHLEREASLREIMGRYTQALLTQISQASACNRLHTTEARCARWLLMTHDRVGSDEFELTQEFLAQMLGVRRATVGEVAVALQEQRIIRYVRGRISVLNRSALERRSCECYEIVGREYARLLQTGGMKAEQDTAVQR
jgi:CRP-like cAMP-binding protein